MTGPDPATDPAVRWQVQAALNQVMYAAQDILMRHCDDHGRYTAPNVVAESGDVTGLIASAGEQVIKPLQARIDAAVAAMTEARKAVDDYKRTLYGPGYQPHRPD